MALMGQLTLKIRRPEDVLWARQEVKRFVQELPFDPTDVERIGLAVSELASNQVKHARGGMLTVDQVARSGRIGVRIVACDEGPGMADLAPAVEAGFSTAGSFGDGLAGMKDLMDKMAITSKPGVGTTVEVEKWAT